MAACYHTLISQGKCEMVWWNYNHRMCFFTSLGMQIVSVPVSAFRDQSSKLLLNAASHSLRKDVP